MKSFNLKWGGVIMLSAFMFVSCEKDDALNQDAQNLNSESQLDKDIQILPFFEVAKGDSISKGVYREKPEWAENEAEEAVELTNEDCSSVLRASHAYLGGDNGYGQCYVLMDIQARSFKKSGDAPNYYTSASSLEPSKTLDYSKINFDLNKGAGGKYVYFYVAFKRVNISELGDSKALRDVCTYHPKKSGDYTSQVNKDAVKQNSGFRYKYFKIGTDGNPNGSGSYKGSGRQVDLNEGAGGRYIYLFGSSECKTWGYITGVCVSNTRTYSSGFRRATGDLNDGAGGNYVFLHTQHRGQK
jgi:hypothetical protein